MLIDCDFAKRTFEWNQGQRPRAPEWNMGPETETPIRRNMGSGIQTGSDIIQRPPPFTVDRMTDMCKNITFPGGNYPTFIN